MEPKHTKNSILNRYFAFIERRGISDAIIFHVVLLAVFATGVYAALVYNSSFLTTTPTNGGTLVEGIVGTPRFVNPVLAITRADHDMAALVYSGLMKIDEEGNLINDVAENIELSEDGRTYHITLKQGVHFHNGSELTAKDIAYTIALIQNPDLKSPLRGNWDTVLVEELGDYEMNIVLEEAYGPFIENFTIGILPRAVWGELPIEQLPFSQHNTEPIGSGPYMIGDVLRNKSGLINAYKLRAFENANSNPNISTIVFNFYQNEEALIEALNKEEIAGTPSLESGQLNQVDTDMYNIIESPLPRTFAVYFNQNKSTALRDTAARKALEAAIDREQLIKTVLGGYGIPTETPVPSGFIPVESASSSEEEVTTRPETILVEGGWQKNADGAWEKKIGDDTVTLSFTITTSNTELFDSITTYVAEQWRALGVEVNIDQFEQADLIQGIIRPRDFQALLFGADIGRAIDLYPFWHSSQKDDPGLNISQYTNIEADGLLKDIRTETDQTLKLASINNFERIIANDVPAIFLFVPTFGYVIDKDVSVAPFARLSKPSERFANISLWHIQTNNLWPVFSDEK